jgi:hypothetical protein
MLCKSVAETFRWLKKIGKAVKVKSVMVAKSLNVLLIGADTSIE